ncbi:hypothetical protein BDZ91DRAFT_735094 [Kalaharituber pfeilii]|nr:hypothetical protein BDZ91DRAFT_735094 [Kalaharituber pfeilii]
MENTGNDRKYMDGHGNDWKQVEASPIPVSSTFYGFPKGSTAIRRVLRLSGGFWGSGFLGQVLAGSSASAC